MTNENKNVCYTRVSTGMQDVASQKFEVERYCQAHNIKIDKYVEDDGISGTVDYKKRNLGKLLKELKEGDTLICSELSRLGRSLFMIFEIMKILQEKKIKLHTIKENFTLSDDIASKTILFAFSLSAEIERDLISKRTKEALAMRKAQGMKLGRAFGSKNKHHRLAKKHDQILNYVTRNKSRYYISRHIHCNTASLNTYLYQIKSEIPVSKYTYYGIVASNQAEGLH